MKNKTLSCTGLMDVREVGRGGKLLHKHKCVLSVGHERLTCECGSCGKSFNPWPCNSRERNRIEVEL